ncbi:NAD(P)/FAD-dependent oxidoreductase [Eubacterium oxidoreducens]|uniref:2,4-dienoyl-CoA reductase n=1 Tax=Eubacterium oxidoreducens TaxID=1732 RepID=A0A1G6BTR1_EUBOX|nr:NAD(P)/FAD-dependent oxidoreductase [Eubacterium oxidoreducens]SDB23989.1 2,4-dienoyl-CoA reductase [Eubacterium oxidoreducens]
MKFEHLLSPMKVGNKTYKNRIVSAPMAFSLIVQNPDAQGPTYRKLESSAKGGNACVIVGELDVNFRDAVRIPGFTYVDFADPNQDPKTFDAVAEYARRIHKHGAIALGELVHCGKEKVPFNDEQEAIGPVETVNSAGVPVRAMTKEDMDRIANDFAVAATYIQKAGYDGVLFHGGHGFIFTQFLSPLMNTRTDEYGGSLENRAKFPLQIIRTVREAVGEDFLLELRIDGTDHQEGGITPEETGQFVQWAEKYLTSIHVTCGIYEESVKSGTESSMFHQHGLNIEQAAIIKQYTSLPVGCVGGINSPEQVEQAIADGKIDFGIFGRQMLADPEFANKCIAGEEDRIRRCLRCYKCFPGSPEEGYDDLPFNSEQLALYVGHCTINPLAHLPFDPEELPAPDKQGKVLVIGGGVAGLQAAMTAADRGHKVTLVEKSDKLGGLLWFTDVDVDKPDLRNFKDMMIREVERRDIEVKMNTEATPEFVKEFGADAVILATGSVPSCPPIPGIEHAHQAMDMYAGKIEVGKKVVMIGGGLVGCEAGLHLQKTGHEVTVVEMLDRVANESFGMYREALVWEMEKNNMGMLPKTKCLKIEADGVTIENADGVQKLPADTVIYALGMKSVDYEELKSAAGDAKVYVIGDAIKPGKVDQATRSGYLAGVSIESEDKTGVDKVQF